MLTPSVFLASAASAHDLQLSMLSASVTGRDDPSLLEVEVTWSHLSGSDKLATESAHIQRACDRPHSVKH